MGELEIDFIKRKQDLAGVGRMVNCQRSEMQWGKGDSSGGENA